MSRFPIRSSRRVVVRRQPIRNMMLDGGGASGNGDRGSMQHAAQRTSNPYYSNNFWYRWQEYTRWYMTSWEARKIIDIPVDDALRLPFEITGVDTALSTDLRSAYEAFDLDRQNRRALIQERLYGGCCQTIVIKGEEDERLSDRLSLERIRRGDLEAFNVVDVSRITRPDYDQNPFSAGYDRAERYIIQGVEADVSRLVVFDGSPLINRAAMNILQNFRYNPAGFGESKLAPLYDLLVRVVGTQQAAYHLVNMASVLLVRTSNLMALQATDSPALTKLEEICKQISLYRGAVIDNPNADVQQHAASFGSVPELVMSFAQLLSAASDIPATRFLGQAPGGLNATGESDLQNYYNMIDAFQRLRITPVVLKQLSVIGPHLMGFEKWREASKSLDIVFPPLWNESSQVKAENARTYAELFRVLYADGVIKRDVVVKELIQRGVFQTGEQVKDFLAEEEDSPDAADLMQPVDPSGPLAELEKLAAAGRAV